jgi:hypothetical protein
MKRIFFALGCASSLWLGTSSYAADPLSFGIKVGAINTTMSGLTEAKAPLGGGDVEINFFNLGFLVGGYGEYAFHDMVGGGLNVNFTMGPLGSFSEKGKKDTTYTISGQRINIQAGPVIYPMGMENSEDGILRINVGLNMAFTAGQLEGKKGSEKATPTVAKDLNGFGVGAYGGVGYELPMGLLFDLSTTYEFTDLFEKNSEFKKTTLGIGEKTATGLWSIGLGTGFNFGVLLED